MSGEAIAVTIQPFTKPGALRAHAIVKISLSNGDLILHGFCILQQPGKPAWVAFPTKAGATHGKYFSVTEAEGDLHAEIARAILEAYESKS